MKVIYKLFKVFYKYRHSKKVLQTLSVLNYCEKNPKTCLNDGKCTSITEDEGSFKCECPSGFKGKSCEIVPMIANSTTTTVRPRTSTTVKPTQPQIETTTVGDIDTELTEDLEENADSEDVVNNEKSSEDAEIDNEA